MGAPTIEQRVQTLESQIALTPSLTQVQALIAAQGTDYQSLYATITAMQNTLNLIQTELQSIKLQLADHETRIAALE